MAIIGIGCRFPGGVRNLAGFWDLLETGIDAIRHVPPDRWRLDDHFAADPPA